MYTSYYCFISGQNIVAYKDTRALPYPTVRHMECSLLMESRGAKCSKCVSYRAQLNVLLSRLGKQRESRNPHSHTNYRYLSDSEKNSRMKQLHQNNRKAQRRIARLEEKLKERTELEDEQVEELTSTADNGRKRPWRRSTVPQGLLHVPVLEVTERSTGKNDLRGMRWHPLMIRWCYTSDTIPTKSTRCFVMLDSSCRLRKH